MIRRLYVDNYRSLVDFTWEPGHEMLVLGLNGSGKTSALDALDVIRSWACGWERLDSLLLPSDRTIWSASGPFKFTLDLEIHDATYRYEVEFEPDLLTGTVAVSTERLLLDNITVFRRSYESVFHFVEGKDGPEMQFPLSRNQSAASSLASIQNEQVVSTFLDALRCMIVVRPMPPLIRPETSGVEIRPSSRFENFVSWYWHQIGSGKFQQNMVGLLNGTWPEFDYLNLETVGRQARSLVVSFRQHEATTGQLELEFEQLSDGERMIVVLYTLAAYQLSNPSTTIIIDEPDNFVGLPELQPWLLRMLDDRPEDGQVIIVSHNSMIIQTFGYEHASFFERTDHVSPTRVRKLSPDDSGLSLSERLARGWLDE